MLHRFVNGHIMAISPIPHKFYVCASLYISKNIGFVVSTAH